ncbi:TetR/AcrR family transcriptional regulator [Vibrio pectenicida]|uniref:TetR/AcrR family transcriptional regulator n=1 Tax=Vibrio pectenicida TaxID=62763 RepID=A0A7Y4EFQ3_9VIBR|nr:TetR/AcrR family transcriptional regulator [Vibrio pectenicida]NOH72817.1 TetR/AcrR family transcriptional regulator [Vibrio pectenicida]
MSNLSPTATKIADIAESYIQSRGFNGFSFRDIQNELGIKTASIHYHFKTKQDLAKVVFERYLERYRTQLNIINQQHNGAEDKLRALAAVFVNVRDSNKLCLCGMYASDISSLAEEVTLPLNHFVEMNETWITRVVEQGVTDGDFIDSLDAKAYARLFFTSMEGSMLLSQFQTSAYIQSVEQGLLNLILKTEQ